MCVLFSQLVSDVFVLSKVSCSSFITIQCIQTLLCLELGTTFYAFAVKFVFLKNISDFGALYVVCLPTKVRLLRLAYYTRPVLAVWRSSIPLGEQINPEMGLKLSFGRLKLPFGELVITAM